MYSILNDGGGWHNGLCVLAGAVRGDAPGLLLDRRQAHPVQGAERAFHIHPPPGRRLLRRYSSPHPTWMPHAYTRGIQGGYGEGG